MRNSLAFVGNLDKKRGRIRAKHEFLDEKWINRILGALKQGFGFIKLISPKLSEVLNCVCIHDG